MEIKKNEVIKKIIEIEWDMFKNVKNVGGPAFCQSDDSGFYLFRESKFIIWPLNTLKMYLNLLVKYKIEGRNICTDKYGYMMKETHPEDFRSIENYLPQISEIKIDIINNIWYIEQQWLKELKNKYPNLMSFGRPLKKVKDIDIVSMENYFKSECMTYNMEILQELLYFYEKCLSEGRSLSEESYFKMMKSKGFESLEEAENHAIELKNKNLNL